MTFYTRPRLLAVSDLRPGDEIAWTPDRRFPLDYLTEVTEETQWLALLAIREAEGEGLLLDFDGLPGTEWGRNDRVVVRESAAAE